MQSTSNLSSRLFESIYTTKDLKLISTCLESLSQNKTFKNHAQNIVEDHNLTEGQKVTQLLYLLRIIDHPLLYNFFADNLDKHTLWLFSSDKVDYFDHFVQEFQLLVDSSRIIHLTTSLNLDDNDYAKIAAKFKEDLGYRIIIDHHVNPSLIGGIQAKFENYLYDLSLRTRFHQFEAQWSKSLDQNQTQVGHHDLS